MEEKGRPHAVLILNQGLISLGNLLTTVIAAVLLGPRDFGIFATLWIAVLVANSFHFAVVVMPLMTISADRLPGRAYGRHIKRTQAYFQVISASILAGVGLAVAVGGFVPFGTVPLLVVASVAYHGQDLRRRLLVTRDKYWQVNLSDSISYIARLPILVVALQASPTPAAVLATVGCSYVLGIVATANVQRPFQPMAADPNELTTIRRHKQLARNLFWAASLQWTSVNAHLLLAAWLLSPASVGAVRLGQSLLGIGSVYLQVLENSFPRRLVSMGAANDRLGGIRGFLKRNVVLYGVLSLLLVAVFPKAVDVLNLQSFGLDRRHAALLVACQFLAFLASLLRFVLRQKSRTDAWVKAYICASAASVLIAWPLQNNLDVLGVFLGVAVSWTVVLATALVFYLSRRDH